MRDEYRTRHWLHLIATILTGGLWVWGWLYFTYRNAKLREELYCNENDNSN